MCAQAAPQAKPINKKKGNPIQINFTEVEDLFLNEKGRALRNLRKKFDKYKELEKQVKKGDVQPNAQQKAQLDSLPQLKKEIDDLEALCTLYMKSNPGYDKKNVATPAVSEEDVAKSVTDALEIMAKAAQLTALMQENSYFVECTEGQRASIIELSRIYRMMNDNAANGSASWTNMDRIEDFTMHFTKLATSSGDIIRGSCSYGELNKFINTSFSDNAKILERIAEKNAEKAQAQKEAEAAAAKIEAEKQKANDEEIAAALGDELDAFDDCFGDDYGAETAAPAKPKAEEAPKKVAEPASQPAVEEDKQAAADDKKGGEGEAGAVQEDGNQRGGRGGRGGRRGDGEYRGRGNRGRGDRGNYRGGRGGYNKNREDEDGFVMQTDEKTKPRSRGNRGRRGGDRGDFRGGRGERDGNRGGRGGRGGRPQTADGGAQGAGQEQ